MLLLNEHELLIELYGCVLYYDIDDKPLGFCGMRPRRRQQQHVNYSASLPRGHLFDLRSFRCNKIDEDEMRYSISKAVE